jgi:ribonuclease HI
VANQDIWRPFLEAYKKHPGVIFTWVKGHAGHPANEMADQLAGAAKSLAHSLM